MPVAMDCDCLRLLWNSVQKTWARFLIGVCSMGTARPEFQRVLRHSKPGQMTVQHEARGLALELGQGTDRNSNR